MKVKVKVKDSAKCQKILEIEVPPQTVQEEFERYYKEISKTALIPGFRKGKAPRSVIEENYAAKANDKVMTDLLSQTYYKALQDENIKPVSMPEILDVNFKKDEKMTYQAKIDIQPDFILKEYKSIKIKKQLQSVKDEDVSKVLEYVRERYAQFSPVENRGVNMGDNIICDYSFYVDGKQVEKKDHVWLSVNEEMFLPGLSKEVKGAEVEKEKTFNVTLPKKFLPQEFAGKKAEFKLLVKEIKEKKLPELNDEFAATLGSEKMDDFKAKIKEDLIKEKEMQVKQDMKAQLINYLDTIMPIDLPPTLVKKREQLLKDTAKQRMTQQGVNEDQIKEEEKKLGDMFEKEAVKQVRIFFILESIAKKEDIKVEEKELDARISLIASSYNQKKEEVLKYLNEKNLLDNIHWELLEEKIVNFLLENAKVEEFAAK